MLIFILHFLPVFRSYVTSHVSEHLAVASDRRTCNGGQHVSGDGSGSSGFESSFSVVGEKGASGGFTNATDCADYLVKRGVPFRDAHAVVGRLVAHCLNENKALLDLSLEELKQFHPAFEADVFDDLSMLSCVEKRRIPGAPAPDMVQAAIDEGRKSLEENA